MEIAMRSGNDIKGTTNSTPSTKNKDQNKQTKGGFSDSKSFDHDKELHEKKEVYQYSIEEIERITDTIKWNNGTATRVKQNDLEEAQKKALKAQERYNSSYLILFYNLMHPRLIFMYNFQPIKTCRIGIYINIDFILIEGFFY